VPALRSLPAGRRIGLLGGSFNPAHGGHLYISERALERLRLDEVWWLVSPQNPLKPATGMAPFQARLAAARKFITDPRIKATDIEQRLGTRYAVDTLESLFAEFPDDRFVWIMGADNLIQAHRWKDWRRMFRMLPIAVFARPSYCLRALTAKAARHFAKARVRASRAGGLVVMKPPAWVFVRERLHTASATQIRARGEIREYGQTELRRSKP